MGGNGSEETVGSKKGHTLHRLTLKCWVERERTNELSTQLLENQVLRKGSLKRGKGFVYPLSLLTLPTVTDEKIEALDIRVKTHSCRIFFQILFIYYLYTEHPEAKHMPHYPVCVQNITTMHVPYLLVKRQTSIKHMQH